MNKQHSSRIKGASFISSLYVCKDKAGVEIDCIMKRTVEWGTRARSHSVLLNYSPVWVTQADMSQENLDLHGGEYNSFHIKYIIAIHYTWQDTWRHNSIFGNYSACGASIYKIFVPNMKRRAWGFQNTCEVWMILSHCSILRYESQFFFLLNCHNLAQNHPNFASCCGCFGILRNFSWWWAQRYWGLMHHMEGRAE